MTMAIYEEFTDTIRKVPESYCLISWESKGNSQANFEVDAATIPYRIYVEQAYKQWKEEKSEDKVLLAEMVSKSIEENYKPFAIYPEYTSSDVYNAIKLLKVRNRDELAGEYQDLNLELWEANKTKDDDIGEEVKNRMDKFVSEIYKLYQSTL